MTAAWPLYGHQAAEAEFLKARDNGRLHHAWMLEGPQSIGKSILARRIGALMLGAASLDASVEDPVVQKIMSDGHPDFRWLARRPDDKGKLKQNIPVDDVRDLIAFFSLRPALGGWRVGVIDSLDELNTNGANALLKTLEEPPGNCLIILVNHGAKPVLPTIRSRCRVLRLSPLSDADVATALRPLADGDVDVNAAARLARGRPGRGVRLVSPAGLAAANAARTLLRAAPSIGDGALSAFIKLASVDAVSFEAAVTELLDGLSEAAPQSAHAATVWLDISAIAAEAAALTLERGQAASRIAGRLLTLDTAA